MTISLHDLTAAQLVTVYNLHSDKPVTRFESRAAGVDRLIRLLTRIEAHPYAAICAALPDLRPVAATTPAAAGAAAALTGAPVPTERTARRLAKEAAAAAKAASSITVRYSTVDGYSKTKTCKTLTVAQTFAHRWVGEHPEIGSTYAVSGDGVGKITVQGCRLDALFPERIAEAAPAPVPVETAIAGKKLTVKQRIMAMIQRPEGVTEAEVCAELGWVKAGATIGRAIKAAPFAVRKVKDGSRTRYFAA